MSTDLESFAVAGGSDDRVHFLVEEEIDNGNPEPNPRRVSYLKAVGSQFVAEGRVGKIALAMNSVDELRAVLMLDGAATLACPHDSGWHLAEIEASGHTSRSVFIAYDANDRPHVLYYSEKADLWRYAY